jgi:hypothetical protein
MEDDFIDLYQPADEAASQIQLPWFRDKSRASHVYLLQRPVYTRVTRRSCTNFRIGKQTATLETLIGTSIRPQRSTSDNL